jgi:hypothetical protein
LGGQTLTWTWRNPLPTGNNLSGIAYGNGQFVAVGDNGTIVASADGVSWLRNESGTTNSFMGIAYGNGQFVAVGWDNPLSQAAIMTSTNGVDWLQRPSGAGPLYGITYGNGRFVAVGWRVVVTSFDGVNWLASSVDPISIVGTRLYGVAYGKGKLVAVGELNNLASDVYPLLLTSADGANWVENQWSGVFDMLHGITYGNGQFVAVGSYYNGANYPYTSEILTSTDGVNWVLRQSGITNGLSGIAFGNRLFVALGGGAILTSTDGATWSQRANAAAGYVDLSGVAYGNGHFVAVGQSGAILESGSLVTLSLTPAPGVGMLSLSLEGSTGLDYTIQMSTDLISWQTLTNITSVQPTTVILDRLPARSDRVFYRAVSE